MRGAEPWPHIRTSRGAFKTSNPHSRTIKADSLGTGPGLSVFKTLQMIPRNNQVESCGLKPGFAKKPHLILSWLTFDT